MADFSALLSKPAAEIKKPPKFPAGTFYATIKQRQFGESAKKKTPLVKLTLAAWEPGNDIDIAALDGIKLDQREMGVDYYLTPDSEFRVVELAKSCGIDVNGRNLGQTIEELLGQRVIVEMKLVPSQDNPEEFFNQVGNMKGKQD